MEWLQGIWIPPEENGDHSNGFKQESDESNLCLEQLLWGDANSELQADNWEQETGGRSRDPGEPATLGAVLENQQALHVDFYNCTKA